MGPCSKCGERPREPYNHSYCRPCANEAMRRTRPKHSELPPDEKMKANARAMAKVYLKRGKLQPLPCEACGTTKVQMHHDDYSKPLQVRWLCASCHREHHKNEATAMFHMKHSVELEPGLAAETL